MTEQQKILRVFKFISLLKCDHGRTIESLAELLEVSARTIYRYLDLMEEIGIDVDTSLDGKRRFILDKGDFKDQDSFTIEESKLLRDLILTGTQNEPLKASILQKLYINSELGPISEDLINGRINLLKTKLAKAMKLGKQGVLVKYHSIHRGEVKDYRIEPFHFSDNYSMVMAYDVNDGVTKQFRLSRIGDVMVLDKDQEHEDQHQVKGLDVFNFTGDRSYSVKLKMSFQAYILMREEYPKSVPYLHKGEDGDYYFIGKANHLYGVGRFVLSMLDEVIVVEPAELKQYLTDKLSIYQQLNDDRQLPRDNKLGYTPDGKEPVKE
jgi:proteasome accessory factor C